MKKVENYPTTVYVIDEEARTVKAVIKNTKYDVLNIIGKACGDFACVEVDEGFLLNGTYSATAKCAENDTFDVEKGKLIARKKAIVKYNKAKAKKLEEVYIMLNTITSNLEEVIDYTKQKCSKFEKEISEM